MKQDKQAIVNMRLEGMTLQQIGSKLGVTRERIRQILKSRGITGCLRLKKFQFKPRKTQTFVQRFWQLVAINSPADCWLWKGKRYPLGYGRFAAMGRVWYAHRLAYTLFHRKSIKHWGLHKCDNPPCVNPHHIYDGTPKDNTRDSIERGRAFIGTEQHREMMRNMVWSRERRTGVRSANAILTVDQVRTIKQRLQAGEKPPSIHKDFPMVGVFAIWRIKQGVRWADVEI